MKNYVCTLTNSKHIFATWVSSFEEHCFYSDVVFYQNLNSCYRYPNYFIFSVGLLN